MFRLQFRLPARPAAAVLICGAAALTGGPAGSAAVAASVPEPVPAVAEYSFETASLTPPAESHCIAEGRRCFTAAAMEASFNLPPLYALNDKGQGVTIAIIDSFGNPNMASDLANFDTQMGLPNMCGEPGAACGADIPTFTHVYWNGKTEVKTPPSNARDPGLQTRDSWAVETSLDVEWAHAIAPEANILNVTTNPAETEGVQGLPAMMDAEQYIVDNGQAEVITQSFGATEESFNGANSLQNLRHAFVSAAADGVTVVASTGDGGTANSKKTPVPNPVTFPFPTVNWPASDPLVTAVGGTYLCTNPVSGVGVDASDPPAICDNQTAQDIGWIDSGGGFSNVFAKPGYQDTLPTGSTPIGTMRGIPDVAWQASGATAPLIYLTSPGLAPGWYTVGGTSCSAPQFAGMVAIAAQIAGHGLGQINPTLYKIASSSAYGSDFYDVTTGNNQADPSIPGYQATTGWDPVTGLGTPNAANLVPDLAKG
jgi:subtilase family serine protease